MKEVEMKAWLKNPEEINRTREYLKQHGTFLKKTKKEDIYFSRPNAETFDFRIREIDGKYIVTKKNYKLVGDLEENDELEFEVSDKDAFLMMTKQLGYVVFLKKTKISEMYDLGDRALAEIVEVPDLGDFLEIEVICEKDENIEEARAKIQSVFEELELTGNVERKQYSLLLR